MLLTIVIILVLSVGEMKAETVSFNDVEIQNGATISVLTLNDLGDVTVTYDLVSSYASIRPCWDLGTSDELCDIDAARTIRTTRQYTVFSPSILYLTIGGSSTKHSTINGKIVTSSDADPPPPSPPQPEHPNILVLILLPLSGAVALAVGILVACVICKCVEHYHHRREELPPPYELITTSNTYP